MNPKKSRALKLITKRRLALGHSTTVALGAVLLSCGSESNSSSEDRQTNNDAPRQINSVVDGGSDWRSDIKLFALRDAGYRGQGVTLALVDTGVDYNHPALQHAILGASRSFGSASTDILDQSGHGTQMAGILIGRSGDYTGIAPNAKLLVINTESKSDPGALSVSAIAQGIEYAADLNVDIVNLSIGGTISEIDFLRQAMIYATRKGTILVTATGNTGAKQAPTTMAKYAGHVDYQGRLVAVTALDDRGNALASFATPCDVYDPNYCLAAPGSKVDTTKNGGGYTLSSGTSVATAVVSGALALLREYWSHLTPEQTVEILLVSARDIGARGVDTVFGRGALDIEAAMRPIGSVATASGAQLDTLGESVLITNSAMSGAIATSADFNKIIIFDDFDRDFALDLSARIIRENSTDHFGLVGHDPFFVKTVSLNGETVLGFRIGALGYNQNDDWALRNIDARVHAGPFYNVARHDGMVFAASNFANGLSIYAEASQSLGQSNDSHALLIGGSYALTHNLSAHISAANLRERGQILGNIFEGEFGHVDDAQSWAMTMGLSYDAPKWAAFGKFTTNMTTSDFVGGAIGQELGALRSQSWSMGLGPKDMVTLGDQLALAVHSPLAISEGEYIVDTGTGQRSIDLRPEVQVLEAEIAYRMPIAKVGDITIGASQLFDVNHQTAIENSTQFNVGITLSF